MKTRLLIAALMLSTGAQSKSVCYGTWGNGAIEGSVQVTAGANFEIVRYRSAPTKMYAHESVKRTLEDAFAKLAGTLPDVTFLIGEIGLQDGGKIPFHYTHQNGLSVDLFPPVRGPDGSFRLFTNDSRNGYGYKEEFTDDGVSTGQATPQLTIDFEAFGEYIYQLNEAATRSGIGIHRVILIKAFQQRLLTTSRGDYLRQKVNFWDDPGNRHDDHFHVDFEADCRMLFWYKASSNK
jgi:murein endopeptidase